MRCIDGVVALWDVRAARCAAKFANHTNRREPNVGCAFSPCLRYVACGSEDRAAYIYDVRTGTQVAKLPGHGDVVSGVAFNPIHPQFASVSYDGTARFYAEDAR